MGIEFHCSHCGKLVRAPSDKGGRRGKCPYCKQSVYIPTPPDQIEELDVAPLNEDEEQRLARLDAEARAARERILEDQRPPPEVPPAAEAALSDDPMAAVGDPEELVIEYVRALHASDLARAEQFLEDLRAQRDAAARVVQRLRVDPMPPPSLSDIPANLFQAFLKKLTGEL